MPFTAARTSMLRGRPPGFPSGIIDSTNAHCASVNSVAYVPIPVSKNLERSLRIRLVTARTFQTASESGAHNLLQIRTKVLNNQLRETFVRSHPAMQNEQETEIQKKAAYPPV